ncbi:MAG: ATP-binding protein [Candidatus Hydrogenedentes bacterium]|nr:ATP-binding protein [Candidatus Hydrogenedentota bacterium]
MLLDDDLITREQLAKALSVKAEKGGYLGQILVELGHITQDTLTTCLVTQCKIPHLSLLDYKINRQVTTLLPEEVCIRLNLLPIDKLGRILTVAMVNPLDAEALEEIQRLCPELRIKPILCDWNHFRIVSERFFGNTQRLAMAPKTEEIEPAKAAPPPKGEGAPELSHEPPPAEMAGKIESPEMGVSDDLPAALPVDTPAENGADKGVNGVDTTLAIAETLRGVMESSLRDLARELRDGIMESRSPAMPPPPDFGELARSIQEAVGMAVSGAFSGISAELRSLMEPRIPESGAKETPGPEAWIEAAREGVASAMRDALQQMGRDLGAALETRREAQPPSPDWDAMARIINEGVAGAVEESMAAMTVQLKMVLASSGEEERRVAERQTSELAERLGEAIAGTREGEAGRQAQLERIAEAAMQSVRQTAELVESHLVAENNRRDLMRGRRARHASVTPFGAVSGADPDAGTRSDESDAVILDALLSETPLESLTFDGFFPGNANAFTFKVCRAVADAPGGEYNPLFLYGSVGTGKTHLISAVGNHILAGGGTLSPRVGYVSASHFAHRLGEAAAENALDVFREHYCHWDVLILDDIQFLGGRVEAQEEFFHIFNALHQKGRQIIIAADKAPDRLGLLEQRLVSRFASGIVAELKAPEWETRMQILRHQPPGGGAPVPEEILSLIAMRVPGDVRKMTGALRKITAFAKLIGKDITVETAQEILSHLGVGEAA